MLHMLHLYNREINKYPRIKVKPKKVLKSCNLLARTLVWLMIPNWTKIQTHGLLDTIQKYQEHKKHKKNRNKKTKNSTILSQFSKFWLERNKDTDTRSMTISVRTAIFGSRNHQCSQHSQKQVILQTIQIAKLT